MKRTLTLLMALALMTSLFAVPSSFTRHANMAVRQAAEKNIARSVARKDVTKKNIAQKNMNLNKMRKAAFGQAAAATQITGIQYGDAYYYTYESETYWDIDLYKDYDYDEDAYTYPELYVSIAANSKTKIAGEADLYYAGLWTSEKDSVEFASGTLTISYDASTGYTFVGEFIDEKSNTYQINVTGVDVLAFDADNEYDELTLNEGSGGSTGSVYTVEEAIADYTNSELADNDEISIQGYITAIQLKPSNFAKYHSAIIWISDTKGTSKDFELYNCRGMNDVAFKTFNPYQESGSTTITVNSLTDSAGNVFAVGDLITAYGKIKKYNTTYELQQNCYIIDKEGVTIDPIEVDMLADAEIYEGEFWGYNYTQANITAKNDSIDFATYIFAMQEEEVSFIGNEWTEESAEVQFVLYGDTLDVTSMTLTAEEQGDTLVMTAVLTINDTTAYQLNLIYFVPESKGDTTQVNFVEGAQMSYDSDYEAYSFFAADQQYIASFDIYTDDLEGSYSEEDIDATLYQINGQDTIALPFYTIDATVSVVNDTTYLEADYFAKDTVVYHVSMWFAYPQAKDTIKISISDAQLQDGTIDYGVVVVYGENNNFIAQLYIDAESVEGEFTLSDLELDNSYFANINGTDTAELSFYTMDIQVSMNEDSIATVVIAGLGYDSLYYQITMTAPVEVVRFDPYMYDDTTNLSKTYDTSVDPIEWNTEDFEDEGLVELYIESADGTDFMYLDFYSDTETIANGVYPIAESSESSFVMASAGYDGENDYPSYYATVEDGYIANSWYLVDGTVTVSDTTIVVAATNSHGNSVNITIILNEAPQPSGNYTIKIEDYKNTTFVTTDGIFTVAAKQAGASNAPVYNTDDKGLRIYANSTFEISSTGMMKTMVFYLSSKGKYRQAELTVNTGNVTYDVTNGKVTWMGLSSDVIFTVGSQATYGSDGATASGQFDFTAIDVELSGTGIEDIQIDNTSVRKVMIDNQIYILRNGKVYNIQGAQVK